MISGVVSEPDNRRCLVVLLLKPGGSYTPMGKGV